MITSRRERQQNTAGLPAVGHDEGEDQDRRGGGAKAALVTLLVLAVLAFVGWGAVTWFGNQKPDVVPVAVPSLTGLTEAAADRALVDSNLKGQMNEAPNEAKTGTVFKQDPAAGIKVTPGSVVKYTISTGPASETVPDVSNFNQEDAKRELNQAGFDKLDVVLVDDPKTPKDRVIDTDPAAGASVAPDTKITLNVASGKVVVPSDQVGRDWALVSNALLASGVNPTRKDVESDKPAGTVLSAQYAGKRVDVGSKVIVEVATAPARPPARRR